MNSTRSAIHRSYVKNAMLSKKYLSTAEVADRAGVAQSTALFHLKAMVEDGVAEMHPDRTLKAGGRLYRIRTAAPVKVDAPKVETIAKMKPVLSIGEAFANLEAKAANLDRAMVRTTIGILKDDAIPERARIEVALTLLGGAG